MKYARTAEQRRSDHANARANEELVGSWLGSFKVGNLDSTDRLDWWIPGVYIEVKEKRQRITARWPLPDCDEGDAFILDELSVRKAMAHFPHAYFVLHDLPGGSRWFLARVDEVAMADRCRLNREGPARSPGASGVLKGKHVVDLRQFRLLTDPATQLLPTVLADQIAMPWKQSALLIPERTS